MTRPRLWVIGHLTIDDVVLRDGTTFMGNAAGASVYAALGARIVGSPAAVVSRRGTGIPDESLERLTALGIVTELEEADTPAIQQWALYEDNGARTYVLHPESGSHEDMSPRLDVSTLPPDGAVHIAPMPVHVQGEWCLALSRESRPTTLDPHDDSCAAAPDRVLALLPHLGAFLPSELEARHLVDAAPSVAVRRFCAAGAAIAVVKLGEQGAVVAAGDDVWHVPALPVRPVDVTGAGDAFCGAFAATLAAGADAVTAATWATAAASSVVEAIGTMVSPDVFDAGYIEARVRQIRPELLSGVPS